MSQLIVPKENFPELDIYTEEAHVRYRLITVDRNRESYWSRIYSVDPKVFFVRGMTSSYGLLTVEKFGSALIKAVWGPISIYKDLSMSPIGVLPHYDVWIQWANTAGANPGEWIYLERTTSTNLDIQIPTTYDGINQPKYITIEVYRPGRPVSRYESQKSFSQMTNVDVTNDTISIDGGHKYTTGSKIVYTSTTPIGGLTSGNTYYIRVVDYYKFTLHSTEAGALANTGKINLSGTPTGNGTITGKTFLMYSGATGF